MNPTASAFFTRPPSAPLPATRPLRLFFASADLEETRLRVGSVMKPHRPWPAAPSAWMRACTTPASATSR